MSKNQSVKVAIRVRPLNKRQTQMNSPLCVETRQNILCVKKQADAKQFLFDYVFGIDTRQQTIFQTSAFSLMETALQGYNGTIFAYGQTGAGKTFTMVGDYKDSEYKGIIPRGFEHLITAIHSDSERKYVMRASFIEIYNEQIMDLLEENSKNKSSKKDLKENPQKGVYIKDLKMIPVKSIDQLFKILDYGNKNRTVFATAMNATSSRSHALFTVHIESIEGEKVKASKVNLVDLAGSQRQSKTQASGDRLKQGAKINLSLSALGNVINALVDGKKGGHIPYRDSKLTRLLQDSLGGNTKTLMIASVSPAAFNYQQTLSTLRYAARARNIKNTPKINEDPKDAMIREYMLEIQKLKKQLGNGGAMINQDMLSPQEVQQLRKAQQQAKQKVEQKEKQLQKKQQQINLMKRKLQEMQGLVLSKEDLPQQVIKARKLKKKKAMKQQELNKIKISQLQHQNDELLDQSSENKKFQSVQKENQQLRKLVKGLRKKLKSALKDNEDLQHQFQSDREDLNITIRQLQGNLSFYRQIASKFMNDSDLQQVKNNSKYNQQQRSYEIAPFLMHEDQISLPKTLKKHQVDDLWKEKRSKFKMDLFPDQQKNLPQISNESGLLKIPESPNQKLEATAKYGKPFIQNRKLFRLSNYTDSAYQQKQYDLDRADKMFQRTNFRITEDSRSKSRQWSRCSRRKSSKKLQPIKTNINQDSNQKRPSSRSRGKQKLEPINKK